MKKSPFEVIEQVQFTRCVQLISESSQLCAPLKSENFTQDFMYPPSTS